jgi:hypothetical protein
MFCNKINRNEDFKCFSTIRWLYCSVLYQFLSQPIHYCTPKWQLELNDPRLKDGVEIDD